MSNSFSKRHIGTSKKKEFKYLLKKTGVNKISELIEILYKILDDDKWLKRFVIWELDFFKLIGYVDSFLDHDEKVSKDSKRFL